MRILGYRGWVGQASLRLIPWGDAVTLEGDEDPGTEAVRHIPGEGWVCIQARLAARTRLQQTQLVARVPLSRVRARWGITHRPYLVSSNALEGGENANLLNGGKLGLASAHSESFSIVK